MYHSAGFAHVRSLFPVPDYLPPVVTTPRRVLGGLYKQPVLETPRLIMRRWQASDISPFMAMNRDPVVMEHFPNLLTPIQALASVEQFEVNFDTLDYSMWSLQLRDGGEFVGSVGLSPYILSKIDRPDVAIGWQLRSQFWGKGLALEAARAARDYAFEELNISELIAIAPEANLRSIRLMERMGMKNFEGEAIDDAAWPVSHASRRQLVYRISPSQIS